jgi:hypothetical protein
MIFQLVTQMEPIYPLLRGKKTASARDLVDALCADGFAKLISKRNFEYAEL